MIGDLRGVIFDIDGVIEFRGQVYPHAVETVNMLTGQGIVLRFLTNSTLKSRASCARRLRAIGLPVSDDQVITASYATAQYLRELRPRSCWIMLEREGLDEFREFAQDTEHPEYLVVGDNRSQFDFDHLNRAFRVLMGGARLIGMQSELVDTSAGEVELNVGSWVELLERASGQAATCIGKPHPYAFELTLQSMELDRRHVLMVGDRVSTDIRGACQAGLCSALLRTGEYDARDLQGEIQPDFVFDSIEQVLTCFHLA